jgi:hypothetical protein
MEAPLRPVLISVAILSAGLGLAFPAAAQQSGGSRGAQPETTGSAPAGALETQPLVGKPLKEVTVGASPPPNAAFPSSTSGARPTSLSASSCAPMPQSRT